MQEKLGRAFPPEQAEVLVDIFDEIRHIELRHAADTQDLKQGLRELTQEVKNLVAAQQHTDERLTKFEARTEQRFQRTDERIAKFEERTEQRFQRTDEHIAKFEERTEQRFQRTDERIAKFEERTERRFQRTDKQLAELTAAQQRTDERIAGLTAAQQRTDERIAGLTAAQQRTDERMAEMVAAQQRADERLAELATAQQRTEESIAELSREMRTGFRELRQAIGGLANRFGFDLEEFVAALLPPYIERHAEVTGLMLERRYFELPDGRREEVDLVGSGQQKGEPVMVLAECRTTIGGGEMRRLADKLTRVAETIPENVLKIVVTMNLHPTGEEAARETGIWAIPYSRINRERGYDVFP
jgi:hypothetical protein